MRKLYESLKKEKEEEKEEKGLTEKVDDKL
jgi:hypothetical protein